MTVAYVPQAIVFCHGNPSQESESATDKDDGDEHIETEVVQREGGMKHHQV